MARWTQRTVYLSAALVMLALAACDSSPRGAYTDMSTAAMMGDSDGFLDGFTKESRDLVKALISFSEAYGMRDSNPYELLVFDSVESEKIADDGKTAVLFVRTRGKKRKILMVYDDDEGWRIDTRKLEEFWKAEGRSWQ